MTYSPPFWEAPEVDSGLDSDGDFQVRPTSENQLWLAFNLMDWPGRLSERKTTIYRRIFAKFIVYSRWAATIFTMRCKMLKISSHRTQIGALYQSNLSPPSRYAPFI
jgi:hypothetical protein